MKFKLAVAIAVVGLLVPRLDAQSGDAEQQYCNSHPFDGSRCIPPTPVNGGMTPPVPIRSTAGPTLNLSPISKPPDTPINVNVPAIPPPPVYHFKMEQPQPVPQSNEAEPGNNWPKQSTETEQQPPRTTDQSHSWNSAWRYQPPQPSTIDRDGGWNIVRRNHYCKKHHGGIWRNPSGSFYRCP